VASVLGGGAQEPKSNYIRSQTYVYCQWSKIENGVSILNYCTPLPILGPPGFSEALGHLALRAYMEDDLCSLRSSAFC